MSTLRAANYCRLLKPGFMNVIPTYHISHVAHVFCESLSIAFEHVSTFPFKLLNIPFPASPDPFALRLCDLAGRLGGSAPLGGLSNAGDLLKICPAEWCMFMYDSPVVVPS